MTVILTGLTADTLRPLLGEVFNLSGQIDDALALFERAWQFAESKSLYAFGQRVLALMLRGTCRLSRV